MKKILKYFTVIAITLIGAVSCDYEDTNFEKLTNDIDPNATFFAQFTDASKHLQTGIDANGDLVDIETTVAVVLLGTPRSEDTVINFAVDPSSTIDSDMYDLSATSITIPAGKTSGSIDLKTITEQMPAGDVLKLVLNLDAGDHNATAGTQLVYNLERIVFCLLELSDYVGTWTGTDSWGYKTEIVTTLVNGDLYMNGIGFGWFQDWWGEVIVSNTPVKVDINLVTGEFIIDRANQTVPYIESTWSGAPQPAYNILASGKITSTCDQIIDFNYSFDQDGWVFDGTSWGPAFKEIIQIK